MIFALAAASLAFQPLTMDEGRAELARLANTPGFGEAVRPYSSCLRDAADQLPHSNLERGRAQKEADGFVAQQIKRCGERNTERILADLIRAREPQLTKAQAERRAWIGIGTVNAAFAMRVETKFGLLEMTISPAMPTEGR